MIKNSFHFILKALFDLEVFQILFWIFGHVGKWLNKKAKVKFMMSQIGWQTITIHVSSDISRSKHSQISKYSKVSENIFLAKTEHRVQMDREVSFTI